MAGFRTRALSAVVLVAILGTALFFGGYYLWALMLFSSLVGFFEFVRAMRDSADRENMKPDILEAMGYAGIVAMYLILLRGRLIFAFYALVILLIVLMIVYVLQFLFLLKKKKVINKTVIVFSVPLSLPLFPSYHESNYLLFSLYFYTLNTLVSHRYIILYIYFTLWLESYTYYSAEYTYAKYILFFQNFCV